MRLKEFIHHRSDPIFRVESAEDWEDYQSWVGQSINLPTLSAKACPGQPLEGTFVIKAVCCSEESGVVDCFMDVTLPERIAEHTYFDSGEIVRFRGLVTKVGKVVPGVAIELQGDYTLFKSSACPEVALTILRSGLERALNQYPIVHDLAYLYRDFGKIQESLDSFEQLLRSRPSYLFEVERARLYEKSGQPAMAERSWKAAEDLSSVDTISALRR